MVRTLKFFQLAGVIVATTFCRTASADGMLEKIQIEVGDIVKSTKGAVVAIEDERNSIVSVRGIDLDKILAQVNDETEKSLREELRKLEKLGDKPEESARSKAETQKKQNDLRAKIQEAQRVSREALTHMVPFLAADAPKSGTGFSIGDGYVVTTADVLEGMENPVIVTDEGVRIKGVIVGMEPDLNIGVIKLAPGAELPVLKWGDSGRVVIGHFGISIGNQNGQMNSVSLNLVAGIRGDGTNAGKRFYPNLIQVAGTVGAGSSGAPLINARGEIIGMLAAVPAGDWTENRVPTPMEFKFNGITLPGPLKTGANGTNGVRAGQAGRRGPAQPEEQSDDENPQPGITFLRPPVTSAGFAIPSNDVRQIVEIIRAGKHQVRGWIGVVPVTKTRYVQDGPYLRPAITVKIDRVVPDSPASRAGLETGDIIVSLNGRAIASSAAVRSASLALKPGDTLAAVIKRGNDSKTYLLQIDARPGTEPVKRPRSQAKRTSDSKPSRLSIAVPFIAVRPDRAGGH